MSKGADFPYDRASDGAGHTLTVSIFGDRPALRVQMAADFEDSGFRLIRSGPVSELLDGALAPLGDAVMLDCHTIDAQGMAALSRLDMRIARSGAELIVMTSLEILDDVFACFDQSTPQILVDPTPAERVVAVGRLLGGHSGGRLRELSRDDRIALLQMTQQVEALARQIEGLSAQGGKGALEARGLEDTRPAFRGFNGAERAKTMARPGLPDPRIVRDIIRLRRARARFFDPSLFADPAWDMLLDLTAARAENTRISVSSLCIASGVPATTALRWIRQLTEAGLFVRSDDEADRRRALISLSDKGRDAMARYFAEIGPQAVAYAA